MSNLDYVRKVTRELTDEISLPRDKKIVYQAVPHQEGNPELTWRVNFQAVHDQDTKIGLDINDEIIIGREEEPMKVINLASIEDSALFGVSRHHIMLQPTKNKLYIVDLGSTNGTYLNGRRLGVKTPYGLSDGDMFVMGQLEVVIRIIKRPSGTVVRQPKRDLLDILQSLVVSIMPHFSMNQVLKHVIEMALTYTSANEACIWLIDELTGEVLLEAEQGHEDESLRYVRLPIDDSLVNKVLQTGEILHINSSKAGSKVRVKTKHFVDSAIYTPIQLGSTTFGVLFVAHRDSQLKFEERDEKIMKFIGELTAIATQNARQYQAINETTTHQNKVLTALNYGLTYNFKQHINAVAGYAGLLATSDSLDENTEQLIDSIIHATDQLGQITERINEVIVLAQAEKMQFSPLDLVDLITSVVDNLYKVASSKSTKIELRFEGEPYVLQGHAYYLQRCVFHLVDNAIRYSPPKSIVSVKLTYNHSGVFIRVKDTGPGLPDANLSNLFDMYYRGQNSEGLGLGLELVRAVVQAHSGTIIANNTEEGGADFLITLPPMLRVM